MERELNVGDAAPSDRRRKERVREERLMRDTVMAEKGPKPAGPYSHAVIANGFVFISGQGPADPETGAMPDAFADQVR
jgi:hypothetical protein